MLSRTALKYSIAGIAAGITVQPTTIHNDSKRSFYEDENDPVAEETPAPSSGRIINGIVVHSPSSLESSFKTIRESIYNVYAKAIDYTNEGYSKYYTTEQKITNTISEMHVKSEDLFPNALWVFVFTLSGSVMARQRSIVSRAFLPVIVGAASFRYFLPQTFANTTDFIWKLEKQRLPEIAKQQEDLLAKSNEYVQKFERSTEAGQSTVNAQIESLRKGIKKYAGLNPDDDVTKK